MPTFKGTKKDKQVDSKIENYNYENANANANAKLPPRKPILPPAYENIDKSPLDQLIPKEQLLLSQSLILNSGMKTDTMKICETINIVFDKITGNIIDIISIMCDDTDNGYHPELFKVPIPDIIKLFKKKYIIGKSTTQIGTLLAIKPFDELNDGSNDGSNDYLSFIIFEKINANDNFDIKVIVNLKYNDIYIKQYELLDVIFVNMNNFWVVLKKDDGIHLIYYYKSKDDLIYKNSSKYSHTNIIIKDIECYEFVKTFTFICTMWTTYDITPSTIYLLVHDENYQVLILQYAIKYNSIPNIELYSVDPKLYHYGKYVSFCANYNISIFSILLELDNHNKCFYTGIMSLSQIDKDRKTQITLEFSQNTTFPTTVSNIEAQLLIYNIMEKTELSIIKEENIKIQKKIKEKKYNDIKKELERKDKEAEDNANKLLQEYELKNKKSKNKKQKTIQIQQIEKKIIPNTNTNTITAIVPQSLEVKSLEVKSLEVKSIDNEPFHTVVKRNSIPIKSTMIDFKRKQPLTKINEAEINTKKSLNKKVSFQIKADKVEVNAETTSPSSINDMKVEVEVKTEDLVPTTIQEVEVKVKTESAAPIQEVMVEAEAEAEAEAETQIVSAENKTSENYTYYNPPDINIPLYYNSNMIELKNSTHTLYYKFIYYITMINEELANLIIFSHSLEEYNEILFINRFWVMYAIDLLVIENENILALKKIMDETEVKDFNISAIYGSFLPIIYSKILSEIGYVFNPFVNHKNPLNMVDCDTMVLKLLDDYIESHTDNEFIREENIIVGYPKENQVNPITRSKIQSSSIHNLICHCWDLNYTSALLLYEKDKKPYIKRHPDFTEFLFGTQPIQLLYGKTKYNLYNYNITMKRLEKAHNKWYSS